MMGTVFVINIARTLNGEKLRFFLSIFQVDFIDGRITNTQQCAIINLGDTTNLFANKYNSFLFFHGHTILS